MTRAGRRAALVLVLASPSCGRAERVDAASSPPRIAPPVPADERVVVRVASQARAVGCASSCASLGVELARLRAVCVADPLSTPHQVAADARGVSLGCCEEARAAYDAACGVEGLERCASAWTAGCESGRIDP